MSPYFTIVTPVFNREDVIGRAIESCLAQEFVDFELVIVDDHSTDRSTAVIESYRDPRVRLVRHGRNRGPGPARNTAVTNGRGLWFVMLDSDFSLQRGALQELYRRTSEVAPDVGNVASSCVWDTGDVSPQPRNGDCTLDYVLYLRWAESAAVPEYFNCIRREVFASARYPDTRAWEMEFHLDLARHWKLALLAQPLVTVHTDAPNRLTADRSPQALRRLTEAAPDQYRSIEAILRKHGAQMQLHSPRLHRDTLLRAAHQAFLAGWRFTGLRFLSRVFLSSRPTGASWGLLAAGVLGATATAKATLWHRSRASQAPIAEGR